MRNIYINDNFSKYFIYNDTSYILFHWDFTHYLVYDGGCHFSVLSDVTINVCKNNSKHILESYLTYV